MNALDTNRINVNSPYKVWAEGLILHFETESGIRYAVDFDCHGLLAEPDQREPQALAQRQADSQDAHLHR